MKKNSTPIREETKEVILYLDDVIYLVELLEKGSDRISIIFKDDNNFYEFNSSGELNELKESGVKKFNNLEITRYTPYMNVNLGEYSGNIYISEDNPLLRGLMEKVKERLQLRYRKGQLIESIFFPAGPSFFLCYGLFHILVSKKDLLSNSIIMVLSVILMSSGFVHRFKGHTIVYSTEQNKVPSFFVQKKDKIIIAMITALVTALITFVITILIK